MTEKLENPELPEGADGPLFLAASRYDTLWAAWDKVRANAGACGGDGQTVDHFGRIAPHRISRLAHELRAGVYRPGPSRRVLVPKKSGGLRPLDIPCVIDRIAQGAVALVLQPACEAEFEAASYAYRPGRSVAQAVRRIAALRREGFTHVVDGDIARYFERVSHELLIGKLEKLVGADRIVDLIALWLECHAPDGRGLPQGSPLSPLLANLYLDAIDEAIEGRGVRLVRYADDFVLLCRGEASAANALVRMKTLLDAHGLELNAEKTRIVDFEKGLRFLGHVFVRSMVWREVDVEDGAGDDPIAAVEKLLALGEDAPEAEAAAGPGDENVSHPRGRWAARTHVLYMVEPGRTLATEGETFCVRERDGALLRLPQGAVDRIEIGPGCETTAQALDLAVASDTEIVRVDGRGQTLGRWSPPDETGRARRHLAQAAVVLDAARRVELARIVVGGRIRNQQIFLKRLNMKRNDPEIAQAAVTIARMERRLLRPGLDVAALMGHEGQAAAHYWPALSRAVDASWSFAGKRIRRSRADPVNMALDVLSNMLARDVRAAALRHGLHPGFGVLHGVEDGADALVFDLMEEFRAPVAEACALALFGRRALRREMFAQHDDGSWSIDRDGWSALIRGYEAWIARDLAHPASGLRTTWRGLFEFQALAYAAHCEGAATYVPYRMDY